MIRLLAAAVLLAGATAAQAQDVLLTGTLKAIAARGTILVGTRDNAVPFSFRNRAGQPIGFSIDLCRGIAADIAAALHQDLVADDAPPQAGPSTGPQSGPSTGAGLRIVYVPITPDARLPKTVSGEIDLECGSTTATDERAKTVAFSPVFFLAGTKLMVRRDAAAASYLAEAGKTVSVGAGTTNAVVMQRLASRTTPPIVLATAPDLGAAYDMLVSGKADAFASDDILLAGLIATKPDGKQFTVVGDYLSYEPYAIMLRRDDPDFAALVRASFERMASEGSLGQLYRRWFMDRLPTGRR